MLLKVRIEDLTYVTNLKYLVIDDNHGVENYSVTAYCEGDIVVVFYGEHRHNFLRWVQRGGNDTYHIVSNGDTVLAYRGKVL